MIFRDPVFRALHGLFARPLGLAPNLGEKILALSLASKKLGQGSTEIRAWILDLPFLGHTF